MEPVGSCNIYGVYGFSDAYRTGKQDGIRAMQSRTSIMVGCSEADVEEYARGYADGQDEYLRKQGYR